MLSSRKGMLATGRLTAVALAASLAGCSSFQKTNPKGWSPKVEPTCSDSRAAQTADLIVGTISVGALAVLPGARVGSDDADYGRFLLEVGLFSTALGAFVGAMLGESKVRACRDANRRHEEWNARASKQSDAPPENLEASSDRGWQQQGRDRYWVAVAGGAGAWRRWWDDGRGILRRGAGWVDLEAGYFRTRRISLVADAAALGEEMWPFGRQYWITFRPQLEWDAGISVWVGVGPSLVLEGADTSFSGTGFGGTLTAGATMLAVRGVTAYLLFRYGCAELGVVDAELAGWTWHALLAIGVSVSP